MSVQPDDGRPETCGACRHYREGTAWCGHGEKQSGKEYLHG